MIKLFERKEVNLFTKELEEQLKNEINNISDHDILNLRKEDFENYYYDKYKIEPIYLFKDKMTNSIEKTKIEKANPFYSNSYYSYDQRYFLTDGYRINYCIPFSGDTNLLYLEPTMRILSNFEIDDIKNINSKEFLPELEYSIEIDSNTLEKCENPQEYIDNMFKKEFKSYENMIGYVNNNIIQYNSNLPNIIKKHIDDKYNKNNNFSSLLNKINIPLKQNINAPNSVPISLEIKKEKAKYPEQISSKENNYCISDNDYNNICNIINLSCISFEKTASTMNKFDEEGLRDIILSHLNTHYDSNATGETFSRNGKTDIRIQFKNKAAYIAECKIWHGLSEFKKAILQLFSYITWRDTKTSLIVFNKINKDFESIIEKIEEEISSHTLCIHSEKVAKNIWKCKFKKTEDSSEIIELNIIICDISI